MRKREDIETIYKAALAEFGQSGYAKSTMESVAAHLSMTKGNLYLYVTNKKGLYREAVSWALSNWQERVRQAVERKKTPEDKFQTMCFKAVEYLSKDDDLRKVLVHDPDIFPMFPDKDPFERINRRSMAMIQDVLEFGIQEKVFRSVNTERMAQVIFMIYKMFIIRWYIHGNDISMAQSFAETLDLMTHGLYAKRP